MDQVVARVHPFGWHANIQLDGRNLPKYEAQIKRLPGKFVIDHTGKFLEPVATDSKAFRSLLNLVDTGRCWVKLSAPYETSKTGAPKYEDVEQARAGAGEAGARAHAVGVELAASLGNRKPAPPDDQDAARPARRLGAEREGPPAGCWSTIPRSSMAIRVGIVGLGMAVTPHAKSLLDLKDRVEVAYAFSPSAARRAKFAEQFRVPAVRPAGDHSRGPLGRRGARSSRRRTRTSSWSSTAPRPASMCCWKSRWRSPPRARSAWSRPASEGEAGRRPAASLPPGGGEAARSCCRSSARSSRPRP